MGSQNECEFLQNTVGDILLLDICMHIGTCKHCSTALEEKYGLYKEGRFETNPPLEIEPDLPSMRAFLYAWHYCLLQQQEVLRLSQVDLAHSLVPA